MKALRVTLLALSLVTLTNCQGSLLEMSQDLWAKLLEGALTKVGKLDPLRVPVVKVDQSEGNTSYRMILRNLEIQGLNDSTLESIHIARGRLKSNLSELEAGYVSYSDLRDLDSIRYRFHTLVKEPKVQNESFEAIVSAVNQENKFKAEVATSQEDRLDRFKQYDPFMLKLQEEQMKEDHSSEKVEQKGYNQESAYGTFNMAGAKVSSQQNSRVAENPRYSPDVQLIYALSAMNAAAERRNSEEQQPVDCRGNCQQRKSYSEGTDRLAGRKETFEERRFGESAKDVEVSASENVETKVRSEEQRTVPGYVARDQIRQEERRTKMPLEEQPGYIDIVYADGKNNGSVKRFGNARMDSKYDARVYGLRDLMKDIRENRRFITHNFTEGESLTKRNEAFKTAVEGKELKDLIRYAKEYQEKQGYFEEGMQLVYHYGGMESKVSDDAKNVQGTRRYKRAHKEDDADEDVIHIILKIRVPLLRVKSQYQLMGKVEKEILRGNGQLNGNFTELTADFTVELKKIKDGLMIVRAARSKLVAKNQNVTLEGLDENGPVKSILSHSLMAAEAVAAMLADDLATKALNEKTADAMIYRMYKNLPANN